MSDINNRIDEVTDTVFRNCPYKCTHAHIKGRDYLPNEAKKEVRQAIRNLLADELESLETGRRYGKDYQDSLDDLTDDINDRIKAYRTPEDKEEV